MFLDTTPAGHTFFELTEQARDRALQAVAQAHHTTWEPQLLTAALTAALATALGHRAGSRVLEVTVWDDDRARPWSLAGTLYPAIAPALPWTPGLHTVSIAWHRRIHIHTDPDQQPAAVDVQAMRTAVEASLAGAWQAAHQQVAAWQALEWVAACRPRFTAAGALVTDPAAVS
jgi:hypothetical protein